MDNLLETHTESKAQDTWSNWLVEVFHVLICIP